MSEPRETTHKDNYKNKRPELPTHDGSAPTLTTVESRTFISCARQTTASANQRWRSALCGEEIEESVVICRSRVR